MADLLTRQVDHFNVLAKYAVDSCGDTTGLTTGIMMTVAPAIQNVARRCQDQMYVCRRHIGDLAANLREAKRLYQRTDQRSANELNTLFDQMPSGLDFTRRSHGFAYVLPGNFDDKNWAPPDPPPPSSGSLKGQVMSLATHITGDFEAIWNFFRLESVAKGSMLDDFLSAILIRPIVGDYEQLNALATGYDTLGNSTYSVAEDLRYGLLKIGPDWNGKGADSFEYTMFEWHEGVGGLGDLLEVVSMALKWVYDKVSDLCEQALYKIQEVTDEHLAGMKNILDRFPRAWAKVLRGGGPLCAGDELPAEDLNDLMERFFKLVEKIKEVIKIINDMQDAYDKWGGQGLARLGCR